MSGILYPDESYTLMGACVNVYKAISNLLEEHKAQVLNYLCSCSGISNLYNFPSRKRG